ncbi:MAG: carboxypeptidase-like regulatory domain-containing protein, partial [Bacteroidaceae bacterium]|nr:carboxypeptidase-like regulatory domain-containing protein [Bacteroidaceae bacterium]
MKRFSILIIFSLCTLVAAAQKITVSGLIMDGTLNEPLPGAAVVLLQPKDSVLVAGVSSDTDGKFKLPTVKSGNYIFRISYIGFQTYTRNITLPKGDK